MCAGEEECGADAVVGVDVGRRGHGFGEGGNCNLCLLFLSLSERGGFQRMV